jgi:hypothetical protein
MMMMVHQGINYGVAANVSRLVIGLALSRKIDLTAAYNG